MLGKIKYIFLVMLALLSVLVIVYIEDRDQLILSQFRVVEAALQTAFHHATNLPSAKTYIQTHLPQITEFAYQISDIFQIDAKSVAAVFSSELLDSFTPNQGGDDRYFLLELVEMARNLFRVK